MVEEKTPTRASAAPGDSPAPSCPSCLSIFLAFLRLGAVAFGGPAMVTHIKRLAVTRKSWLAEADFQQGIALCQAVPGATAMQCAAYVGLRVRGLRGAVSAYLGFGLPAFVLMLSLSIAYRCFREVPALVSMLTGLRALVVALVANSAWTFARSSVKRPGQAGLAVVTAVLFFLGGSPFLIVAGAGLAGIVLAGGPAPPPPARSSSHGGVAQALRAPALVAAVASCLVGVLWLESQDLARLGLVMMKVDLFAFGGGFAAVPLMFREIVDVQHWLPASVLVDGIALGQVTPGPVVITATFVGYQAWGLAGALVATACIFLPSLFAVVLVEPWFDRLRSAPFFQAMTQGLVLSFAGLLTSTAVRFGLLMPWSAPSVLLAAGALTALLCKVDVLWVVLAGGATAILVSA